MDKNKWYEDSWDKYWGNIFDKGGNAIWDVSTNQSNDPISFLLKTNFDDSIPLLDLGCGVGDQTNVLAQNHPRTIGADISERAIQTAKVNYPSIEFRRLNVFDDNELKSFRSEFGNVHIHCRGVLHQIDLEDREQFILALAGLAGSRGNIFFNEMATDFKMFISSTYLTYSNTPQIIKEMLVGRFLPQEIDVDLTSAILKEMGYDLTKNTSGTLGIVLEGEEKPGAPSVNLLYENNN